MRTGVCGGGVRCVRGMCRRLPPRSLQAVVLLGQLFYRLLQVSSLLSLMLQDSLPSAAVALGQLQEITACLSRHGDTQTHVRYEEVFILKTFFKKNQKLSFNPCSEMFTSWTRLRTCFLSHNHFLSQDKV